MALIMARVVALAVQQWVDGTSGIESFLSQGPTPPQGRTVVIHPDPGGREGPLGDPDRDLRLQFQTTSIGETPEQALWTHDQVAEKLEQTEIRVEGMHTLPVYSVEGSQQPIIRDEFLADPIFYVTQSWVILTQPEE